MCQCPCPCVHIHVAMSMWQCLCDHIHVAISMCPCPCPGSFWHSSVKYRTLFITDINCNRSLVKQDHNMTQTLCNPPLSAYTVFWCTRCRIHRHVAAPKIQMGEMNAKRGRFVKGKRVHGKYVSACSKKGGYLLRRGWGKRYGCIFMLNITKLQPILCSGLPY